MGESLGSRGRACGLPRTGGIEGAFEGHSWWFGARARSIRRYVRPGHKGNYNAGAARLWADLSFFTADDEIGEDATDLFNFVTGYSAKTSFHKLLVAPITCAKGSRG